MVLVSTEPPSVATTATLSAKRPLDDDKTVSPLKKWTSFDAAKSPRLRSVAAVLNDGLGMYMKEHLALLQQSGWVRTIRKIRPRGDLSVNQWHCHPAAPNLSHFAEAGAPAVMQRVPWSL